MSPEPSGETVHEHVIEFGAGRSDDRAEIERLTAKNEQMARALSVAHAAVGILYEKAVGDEVRAVIQTALDIITEAMPGEASGGPEGASDG